MKHHKHHSAGRGKMIDNRMVKDKHQEGISRVLQRGHNELDYCGHFGGMDGGWKQAPASYDRKPRHPGSHAGRSLVELDSYMTPRKA